MGIVLNKRGRYLAYFEETYKLWFLSGLEAGSEDNLQKCCGAMALDYDDIVSQAAGENTQPQYDGNTRKAENLGVFGAPFLLVRRYFAVMTALKMPFGLSAKTSTQQYPGGSGNCCTARQI